MKAAACPEIFEFPGPGAKKIARGHLQKPPLRSHPNTKGGTIPGGMHRTGGPSGKTFPMPELVELAGPEIMGAFNANEKVGTLQGGSTNENITCPEIVDTVRTALTTPTEKILPDDEMVDTEDVETSLLEIASLTSMIRQTRQEIEGGGEGSSRPLTTLMFQA